MGMRKPLRIILPVLVLGALAMMVVLPAFELAGTAEIRLDCGDLRRCFLGLKVPTHAMPEPMRSQLLSLAEETSIPGNTWCRCATFPLPSSNRSHFMCQEFYKWVVPWIENDRELSRLMLEDIAGYVQRTKGERDLPSSVVLSPVPGIYESDNQNVIVPYKVRKDWRESAWLKMVLDDTANGTPFLLYLREKIDKETKAGAAAASTPKEP